MSSFDFDHVSSGDLIPIDNHVIVTNIDDEGEIIKNGIIIPSEMGKERGVHPRWAQVHAIGPNQHDVIPGQWVLIEHGRWTRGVKLENHKVYRKVDPDGIMGISDERLS